MFIDQVNNQQIHNKLLSHGSLRVLLKRVEIKDLSEYDVSFNDLN